MNITKELGISNDEAKYIVSVGVKILKQKNPQLYNILKRYNQSRTYCLLMWAVCVDFEYDTDTYSDPWGTFEYYIIDPTTRLWYNDFFKLLSCLITLYQKQQQFADQYNTIRAILPDSCNKFESDTYNKAADIMFIHSLLTDTKFKTITKLTVEDIITALDNTTLITQHSLLPFEDIRIKTINSLRVLQNIIKNEKLDFINNSKYNYYHCVCCIYLFKHRFNNLTSYS